MKISSTVCAIAICSCAAAVAAAAAAAAADATRSFSSSSSRRKLSAPAACAAAASMNAFLMISSTHFLDAAASEHSATTWSSNHGMKSVSISRCTGS